MQAGKAAAIGIDGQSAPGGDGSATDQCAAFPFPAIPQVFQEQDRIDRERVVELQHVDILGRQAGHLESSRPRLRRPCDRKVVHLGNPLVGRLGRDPEQVDGFRRAIPCPVGPRQDNRTRPVADQAAIGHGEGVAHHARTQHVLDAERAAHGGLGILPRPGSRRHRYFRQLFARRSELVHVARGSKRVRGHQARPVGGLVGDRHHAAGTYLAAARIAAVADERDLAQSRLQRERRPLQEVDERRSAEHGAFDHFGADAEILGGHRGRQRCAIDDTEYAVHVGLLEGRIGECALHRLRHQLEIAPARHLAEFGLAETHDRRLTSQSVSGHLSSPPRRTR